MARKALLNETSSESEDGGVPLNHGTDFKVNEEFARRFEHNKKREELQQLQEKLGKSTGKRKRPSDDDGKSEASSDSSSSEEEDDEGELATTAIDSEIQDVLNAIRNKDPRLYDEKATFFKSISEETEGGARHEREKPMYLRDYHRENLLREVNGEQEEDRPKSYAQEQEDLKNSIMKEIHAAAHQDGDDSSSDEEEDADRDANFLVPKARGGQALARSQAELDIENAEHDPETYLSNFMASRAWVPTDRSRFQPLESDDEEEDRRAEEFEQAYNFRFEDPEKANIALVSHARDITAQRSVRREEANPRKKKREMERQRKEVEKQERVDQKARLRKLKVEELENKLNKVKQAAGLRGRTLQEEDWAKFIDEGWDDERWDQEMQKRFGEEYYAEYDDAAESEDEVSGLQYQKKTKQKKPKWDDDIDVKDLIPDFVEEEEPRFTLSDEDEDDEGEDASKPLKKRGRHRIKEENEKKRQARKERRKIEQLVDEQLDLDPTLLARAGKRSGLFRYRETSPLSYGLSARDILMADDSQLNEFAGLKKLASFRPLEKKTKDQKRLGKKARLRQWRKDTFGDEEGPSIDIPHAVPVDASNDPPDTEANGVDIREGGKKKKHRRSKKSKNSVVAARR